MKDESRRADSRVGSYRHHFGNTEIPVVERVIRLFEYFAGGGLVVLKREHHMLSRTQINVHIERRMFSDDALIIPSIVHPALQIGLLHYSDSVVSAMVKLRDGTLCYNFLY